MTELLTAAQMREIEQAAIESGEVTGLELMERAGQGVVAAILEEWPEYKTAPQAICVMCGPGNNGGDGFVIARLLAGLGWDVQVFFAGDAEQLPPDARVNYDIWSADNEVHPLDEMAIRRGPFALYIDAIFGIGLNRAPAGEVAELLRYLAGSGGDHATYSERLVAVDVPSGLCADSGKVLGTPDPDPFHSTAPFARLTVTFDSPKTGHYLASGPEICGRLVVADIGLEEFRKEHGSKRSFNTGLFGKQANELAKFNGHKFDHGHAVVLSGPAFQTGAARLAARGALRVGAGLVSIGAPRSALPEIAAQITGIMLRDVSDVEAMQQMLADRRVNAVCIGPGFGLARARGFVEALLDVNFRQAQPLKVVLDADALSCFEGDPEGLLPCLTKHCVLTPHMGEFARIFPDLAQRLKDPDSSYSKCDAVRDAAKRAGCSIVLKGADTLIGDELGRVVVNSAHYESATPWLATAGAGDVLAGFVTGLAARRWPVFDAACYGVRLHHECALSFGPGLIAEDIPEELPKVFGRLGVS